MSLDVLVTGATGFTGRRVVRALVRDGHQVTAFVRMTSDPEAVRGLGVPSVVGDLALPDTLSAALSGREALVNVASLGFGHAPGIVEAARDAGIRRSVFLGTTAVRAALDVPTKAVRLEAERLVLSGSVGGTLLRPTMIYGAPGDRNLEWLIRFVRRWPVIPVPGDGKALQQPVHVEDVAAAVAAVLPRTDLSGRDFDLPGPEPLTFDDLLRTVARVLGRTRPLLHVPLGLARAFGWLVGVRKEQLQRLAEDKSADLRPAGTAFGYAPRTFEEGISEEVRLLGLAGEAL